jgi:hydrogenase expression/formation protein HypE
MPDGRLALTTDSYVVSPLFFPGGDIGALSVYGTVNDLSVVGARPLYLTAGFIIEEGFPFDELKRIVKSMSVAAEKTGVRIAAGDTKVLDRGKGDGMFINTAGVGVVPGGIELSASGIRPGDRIILSGCIGNHGVAVMSERNGLSFDPPVLSDAAPLTGLVQVLLEKADAVRVMRDPTRGGLATTLKEFALSSGLCMAVSESEVPLSPGVRGACDLLGLDPLYVANEGVLLAVTSPDVSEYLVGRMRKTPLGAHSAAIGEVEESPEGSVLLRTEIGGRRMLQMLEGEQLPRIC